MVSSLDYQLGQQVRRNRVDEPFGKQTHKPRYNEQTAVYADLFHLFCHFCKDVWQNISKDLRGYRYRCQVLVEVICEDVLNQAHQNPESLLF